MEGFQSGKKGKVQLRKKGGTFAGHRREEVCERFAVSHPGSPQHRTITSYVT